MHDTTRKLFTAVFALLFSAGIGVAYAGGLPGGYAQQDAPKDCVKNPNDPRCKAKDSVPADPQQGTPKDCVKNPNDPRCKKQ